MTKTEFVANVMANDREGVDEMTVEMATDILGWMRGDDEKEEIPADLTPEEFVAIWNEMK